MTSNVAHERSDRRHSPTARPQTSLSFVPSNIPSTTELSNPNGTLGSERVQKSAQSAGTGNIYVAKHPPKSLDTPSDASGASGPAPLSSENLMSIPKKANLLTDLMDTETTYVELLAGIIKKVAGAWSRSNLPPQELDTMFRAIESIYKAHRSLLMRLKDIAFDPSSAKVLGDLLMGWAEELEQPYANYSNNYLTGFDSWKSVQANDRVRTVLAMFSSSYPPSLPPSSPEHPPEPPIWKLDGLFLLPQSRLKYYHKLYSRLLKSSAPGKGDHELLSKAVAKVEKLLNMLSSRATMRVAVMHQSIQLEGRSTTALISAGASTARLPRDSARRPEDPAGEVVPHDSNLQRGSPTRANPLATHGPDIRKRAFTPLATIAHLERRLSTDRTLDIFTMKPKEIRLQISPPSLQYAREVRFSADVAIQLTPQSTGEEVRHDSGRVFVLTDLLLVCERMTPEEQIQHGQDGPDMWLLYPPLAGKHLQTGPIENSTTAMSINIIGKEMLILNTRLPHIRDRLLSELSNCIGAFANLRTSIDKCAHQDSTSPASLSTVSLQQPSDLPVRYVETHSGSMAPPVRVLSPNDGSLTPLHPPHATQQPIPSDTSWVSDVTTLALTDASKPQMQRLLSDPNRRKYPPRSTSIAPERCHAQPPGGPPLQLSFSSGQVVPPQVANSGQLAHGTSFRPGQIVPIEAFTQSQPAFIDPDSSQPSFNPGQIVPVRRGTSMRSEHYYVNGEIASQPPIGQFPSQGFRSGGLDAFSNGPGQSANLTSRSFVESADPGSFRRPVPSRLPRSQYDTMSTASAPIMPAFSRDAPQPRPNFFQRAESLSSMRSLRPQLQPRHPPLLPSQQMRLPPVPATLQETSPPCSPVEEMPPWTGPTTTHITMQMKCKVFLQQQHQQWKSLGYANLKLYCELPTYVKQLVVESGNKDKSILISTIILADGVERVGKTGVAVELSDRGRRSGIIYMLQLRNEQSAEELFERLIAGSDRSGPTKNAH